MSAPFSAATAFTNNNNNTDGWGDEWGDWGSENPNSTSQQNQSHLSSQPPTMNANKYFQAPQQHYPPQQVQMDQSNKNFMPNATPAPHQFQNFSTPTPPMQHPFQPNYQQQQHVYHQPQQQYVPPPASASFFNQTAPRVPSYPSASTTPQLNQSYNQTISDSFSTSAGDSWAWNVSDSNQAASNSKPQTNDTQQQQQQQNAIQENYNQSYPQLNLSPSPFSLPGGANNTQQPPKVQAAQITRIKNETLSPQWSIESQVSQTSSDRSIESGEIAESRSSNTMPSDDGSSGRHPGPSQQIENYENIASYGNQFTSSGDVSDKLDETLSSLSIKQEPLQETKRPDSYRESSFPPPPPSIATNTPADGGVLPPKASSRTPPLPPPPTEVGPTPAAHGPPPNQAPPKGQGGNPFKRVGHRSHIATPGLGAPTPPAAPTNPNYFYSNPPQDISNVENPVPENLEIPDSRVENVENMEVAPNNDRNQYLQTGHLSEEGYTSTQHTTAHQNEQQPGEDSLPPPGLSRYVPGQQQSENNTPLMGHNFPEPPPGLDRMIPGTDLENATDLNMERQIDGEVSDSASNSNVRTSYTTIISSQSQEHHHHHHHRQEQERISDRNLYQVPGESDTHYNQQRVIPGVEDDRAVQTNSSNYTSLAQPVLDIPMNEEQRELVMDGENPHDPPPQTIHVDIPREEPIEGGNTQDDPIVASAGATPAIGTTETDSNLTMETPRKDPSNTSTADESDKDRSMFYSKGKTSRREEDPLRRSNKSKSSRDRYDTEDSDYSEREKRRREREGSSGFDGAQRDRRRGEREIDKDRRKDGGKDRDRQKEKDRDYDYRDRDRHRYDRERERDRYGRGSKYERDSRYETDGSKYETERSMRYDKDGDNGKRYMSREEYYRKREERGGDDRRYRKEKDRERYRDERKRDDRYRDGGGDKRRDRRYEYDDYRTGSRNGTERDRLRDSRERDDRKERDRKYPSSAYGGTGYGSTGYYDPYTYYTQHQQYYEQLRRTNPQAYAEWYRTYYSQIQAAQMQRDLITTDGRESVHSGRSSANDKERLNRTTPFLHQPGMYNPEDYHRHFSNQSQPSAMLDQSFLSEASGHPAASLSMFHHQQTMFQQQQQQQHQQQQQQQQRATPLVMDRSYHVDSGYYQPRLDNTDGSIRQEPTSMTVMEPERLTPRKFPEIHPIVSISCGLLVTAKNRLTVNGTTDLVKILSLGANEPTRKLFHSYPGPLVKDKTHKKSVIEFCEEQLRCGPPSIGGQALVKSRGNSINSLHSLGVSGNRGSFTLLWSYIILLLRQNGTFVGTDISELLMHNKREFPFESHQTSARSTNVSGRNSSLSTADRKPREPDGEGRLDDDADETVESVSMEIDQQLLPEKKEQLSELEITDKFRNYLIYGNISDALEWATENNLWGHALFLASKVDSRQHANVMMKFANKLTLNDPLQTLYQLLSGRTPSAVSCVLDEKWGDWRPHLAMLVSNSSTKPELIKKSITTLGDSLYNRGDLYAAHFCYLLSDVAFGRFSDVKQDNSVTVTANTTVRLILLGATHFQRNFKEFSTNESIMMTEIYEYARSLNEERYTITELQHYKYLLACRMLDYGMQLKCLLYMEQIAEQIQLDPYHFEVEFIKKIYTLGDRLKYYDPVLEKALDESVDNAGRGNIYSNVEDPSWLQRLSTILKNYETENSSKYVNVTSSEMQEQTTSQYSGYVGYSAEPQQQQHGPEQSYSSDPSDINKQFAEINQQFSQLNKQYADMCDQQQSHQPIATQYDHQTAAPSYDQGYDSINQLSLQEEVQLKQQQQQQQQQTLDQSNSYGYDSLSGQPSIFMPVSATGQSDVQHAGSYDYWGSNSQPASNRPVPSSASRGVSPVRSGDTAETPCEIERNARDMPHVMSATAPLGGDRTAPCEIRAAPYPADTSISGGAEPNNYIPQPSISMPNAVSNRPGFAEDDSNSSPKNVPSKPVQSADQLKTTHDPSKKGQPAKDAKVVNSNQSNNSGWFGGIWNKFSLKPKNQMILPDDKNPTIVWDPETKKWVNTEASEGSEEAFKPPPKMADILPASLPVQGPATVQPAAAPTPTPVNTGYNPSPPIHYEPNSQQSVPDVPTQPVAVAPGGTVKMGEPTKVPTLQSNMFKMQRNRTLKKSYVDVFNPSGAAPSRPVEPILAPAVPTIPTPQGGFFVPGPSPVNGGPGNENSPEGVPQFYNPNQYTGGYQQ